MTDEATTEPEASEHPVTEPAPASEDGESSPPPPSEASPAEGGALEADVPFAEVVPDLPPLPADHVRPSVEQFVAAGYKAENYEEHMLGWEREIRQRIAAAPPAPVEETLPLPPPPSPPVLVPSTAYPGYYEPQKK